MKHYSAVCFDFDYTLGDSADSIVAGFQYGFERLGHPVPDRETVRGHHRLSVGGCVYHAHRGPGPGQQALFGPIFWR